MSKIFIGIILALLLAFGGYYWISEKRIATLTENNAKLTIAAQTNQETIDKLEEAGLVATVSGNTNGVVRKQLPRKGEFLEPEGVVELTFDE